MRCPNCGSMDDKVIDSRPLEDGSAIRRRRECQVCRQRFTTYEKVENLPVFVIKKDGSREMFDRDKLILGLSKACQKRPVAMRDLEKIANAVEQRCSSVANREVASREIGEMVMEALRGLDKVAYVRFASVYRQFADLDSFVNEMKKLVGQDGGESHASPQP